MQRFALRVVVGCAALVVGVFLGSMHQKFVGKRLSTSVTQSNLSEPPPQRAQVTPSVVVNENYPETSDLNPRTIEYFIDQHPQANLKRLWERLRIVEGVSADWLCSNCKAHLFHYNLDEDTDKELLLRIADPMRESYRYLIFKRLTNLDTKLLGYIDARGKYRPSTHVVMLSGGKAWLAVESQAANGSGLAAYRQTIYQVSSDGVKPAVSYFSEISQSGLAPFPGRHIVGYPVSCEIQDGRVKATVSYTVEYAAQDVTLFEKQQTAVLVGAVASGRTRLDTTGSNIARHEFETIFNFDSMGEEDFLNYNRSELRAIAVGRDAIKKKWLKRYLDECGDSSGQRELLALLH